jgi:alkanesulfonate monooxygenase SsuD/methylene tetrahydromethanopterin reductase-like flavin-dependent oxidoreductase (luciferase family)
MRIGVVYPQYELRGDPTAVRRFGTAVEDLGFDHILAYDHVLGAVHADREPPLIGPYNERDPFHDSLVMFAYLAAVTERIRLPPGSSSFLSVRPPSSHVKPPMSICSRGAGSGSASA